MQDSLEDYINHTNNVNSDSVRPETNENENTFTSDARALKIVEFAIDGKLRPEVFIKCLNYINPAFYQDIVEERHIAQYCGYPICGKKITDKHEKQYFISTKANKVYDITERRNFCCNFCYKASNYIKEQIESSPLCFRTEQDCSKFQLLSATENGIPGEEVLVIHKNAEEPVFTSVIEFAEASLDLGEVQGTELTSEFDRLEDIDENRKAKNDELASLKKINVASKYTKEKSAEMKCNAHDSAKEYRRSDLVKEVKTEVVENCRSLDKRLKLALEKVTKMKEGGTKHKPLLIETGKNPEIRNHLSKPNKAYDTEELPSSSGTKMKSTEQTDDFTLPNMDNIFHCFTSWTTLDTFIFLHGEDCIRTALTERKLTDLFDRLRVSELSTMQQVRYRDICRRMHMQDIMEKQKDGDLVNRLRCVERKPLPEYGELKKESKELTVKVKAFLSGVSYDLNSSTAKLNQSTEKESSHDSIPGYGEPQEVPAFLPLVDHSSRSAIRRRIFLNSANPQFRKHILALKLDENLMEEMHHLVQTFQLSSKDIVFKPNEWKLIGIALLEIVTIRNIDLQNYLKSDIYQEYIQSEFSCILDFKDYITGIKNYLLNVELFMELYISSVK